MRALPVLFIICILCGCCKKKDPGNCTVKCDATGATGYFTGYSLAELDTVTLKTYKNDTLFDSLIKEETFTNPQPFNVTTGPSGLCPVPLLPYFDYEISIPAANRTYRIIMIDSTTTQIFPCNYIRSCFTPFVGAEVTGGTYAFFSTDPLNWYVQLKK